MSQESPQDIINQFFLELDRTFPGHPFIMKWGPADTFKEYLEKQVDNTSYYIEKIDELEDDIKDLEDIESDLIKLEDKVKDAINNLDNYLDNPVENEQIEQVIKDLKDAIK